MRRRLVSTPLPATLGILSPRTRPRRMPAMPNRPSRPLAIVLALAATALAGRVKADGTGPADWPVEDGLMTVGRGNIKTEKTFGNFTLHLEFNCPYEPEAKGQARGNSGVYLQGRYELQVLDSYGLTPQDN